MPGIGTGHVDAPLATNNFAVLADALDARTNLHGHRSWLGGNGLV